MANKVITLETDWGAPGAQLTGAEVQSFIKKNISNLLDCVEVLSYETVDIREQIDRSFIQAFTIMTGCSIAYLADDNSVKPVSVEDIFFERWDGSDCVDILGVWVNIDGAMPIIVSLHDLKCKWAARSMQNYDNITKGEALFSDFQSGYTRFVYLLEGPTNLLNSIGVFEECALSEVAVWQDQGMQWWIPSVAELVAIYKNKAAINFCLDVMGGVNLRDDWHWSIMEATKEFVWCMNFKDGKVSYGEHYQPYTNAPIELKGVHKKSNQYYVRPITSPHVWGDFLNFF